MRSLIRRRLTSRKAVVAYGILILIFLNGVVSAASNIDFVLTASGNSRLVRLWDFFATPKGNLLAVILAVAWITILVFWPERKAEAEAAPVDEGSTTQETAESGQAEPNPVEKLESRVKEQGEEITRLKEAGKEAAKEVEQFKTEAESNRLKAEFKQQQLDNLAWGHEFVRYQVKALRKWVVVEGCEVNPSPLTAGKQYVEFTVHVRNYSMFRVSIPMSKYEVVKGAIKFKGDPISGEAKLVENQVADLEPYGRNYFKIWQWVNSKEAEEIPATLETVGNRFDFSETIIHVCADKAPRVLAPLDLTHGMQNAALENKLIQLEAQRSIYEAQLKEWEKVALQIERLSMAHGMGQEIYNELNHDRAVPKNKLSIWLLELENDIRDKLGRDALSEFNKGQVTNYDDVPEELHEQERWMRAYLLRVHNLIKRLYLPSVIQSRN